MVAVGREGPPNSGEGPPNSDEVVVALGREGTPNSDEGVAMALVVVVGVAVGGVTLETIDGAVWGGVALVVVVGVAAVRPVLTVMGASMTAVATTGRLI